MQVCPGLEQWRKAGQRGSRNRENIPPRGMFGLVQVLLVIWYVNFLDCHILIGNFTSYQN